MLTLSLSCRCWQSAWQFWAEVRVFSFVPGCSVLHTLLIIPGWQPHSSHSSPLPLCLFPRSACSVSSASVCFSLPPHRVLPHSRASRHSGLLIHLTDTSWACCVLFRTCRSTDSLHHTLSPSRHRPVPSAEPVPSPPLSLAGRFLYAIHDTQSPSYCVHYLENDSGSEKYTMKRGENNQPPLTGCVDHCWLQATFKKGYCALLWL